MKFFASDIDLPHCFPLSSLSFLFRINSLQGLPKEWQQLLQESGISKQDQEANPQAVMDIVAFYQDATQNAGDEDAVWKKFGAAKGVAAAPPSGPGSLAAAVEQAGTNAAASIGQPVGGVYEKPVSSSFQFPFEETGVRLVFLVLNASSHFSSL